MTKEFVKYPKANHSLTAGLQLSVYVSVSARLPTTWGQGLCMPVGCIGYSRQSIHVDWIEWVNIRPEYDHDYIVHKLITHWAIFPGPCSSLPLSPSFLSLSALSLSLSSFEHYSRKQKTMYITTNVTWISHASMNNRAVKMCVSIRILEIQTTRVVSLLLKHKV